MHPSQQDLPATLEEVHALEARADRDAARRLRDLAAGPDKAVAKAARTALYRLRLKGIQPDADQQAAHKQTPAHHSPPVIRAWITHPYASGRVFFLFLREGRIGEASFSVGVQGNLFGTAPEIAISRVRPRALLADIARMAERGQPQIAEVEPDIGRHLAHDLMRLAEERTGLIPKGWSEACEVLGHVHKRYEKHPLYSTLDEETLRSDLSIGRNAAALFELPSVSRWVLPPQQLQPWVERYVEAGTSRLALNPSQILAQQERVLEQAIDALAPPETRPGYRRILETAALVQLAAGNLDAARRLGYQAVTLPFEGEAHLSPFLLELARHSVTQILRLMEQEQEEQESQPASIIVRP